MKSCSENLEKIVNQMNGYDLANLISTREFIADLIDLEAFGWNDLGWFLQATPHFAIRCDWESLSSSDIITLLNDNDAQYMKIRRGGEILSLTTKQPQLAIILNFLRTQK